MRKRFLLISTILVLSAFTFAACGKKSPSSPEASSETTTEEVATEETTTEDNTADTTAEEEKPVSTATEATKDSTEETTASKKDEQAKPKTATGTYNGFADTNSVEIELSNGTFETFIVNDDDVKIALSKKSEGDKITFTYGAVEGQANKEILSVK